MTDFATADAAARDVRLKAAVPWLVTVSLGTRRVIRSRAALTSSRLEGA